MWHVEVIPTVGPDTDTEFLPCTLGTVELAVFDLTPVLFAPGEDDLREESSSTSPGRSSKPTAPSSRLGSKLTMNEMEGLIANIGPALIAMKSCSHTRNETTSQSRALSI